MSRAAPPKKSTAGIERMKDVGDQADDDDDDNNTTTAPANRFVTTSVDQSVQFSVETVHKTMSLTNF